MASFTCDTRLSFSLPNYSFSVARLLHSLPRACREAVNSSTWWARVVSRCLRRVICWLAVALSCFNLVSSRVADCSLSSAVACWWELVSAEVWREMSYFLAVTSSCWRAMMDLRAYSRSCSAAEAFFLRASRSISYKETRLDWW